MKRDKEQEFIPIKKGESQSTLSFFIFIKYIELLNVLSNLKRQLNQLHVAPSLHSVLIMTQRGRRIY